MIVTFIFFFLPALWQNRYGSWTSTAYTESVSRLTSDLNPEYRYDAAVEDPYRMKRKIVRGGTHCLPADTEI